MPESNKIINNVVILSEMKVLLNPDLMELKKIIDKCKIENCQFCRQIKLKTGIITKI